MPGHFAHGIEYARLANIASPELLVDHPEPLGFEVRRSPLKTDCILHAGGHDENGRKIPGPQHVTILLRA
jgi:hypothetical protein